TQAPTIDDGELPQRFADAISAGYTNASDYGRVLSGMFEEATFFGAGVILPELESGVTELRVVVAGPGVGSENIRLFGPNGRAVDPFQTFPNGIAFKVDDPAGGWVLQGPIIEGPGGPRQVSQRFFVEASVRSQVQLFASVDV